MILEAKGFCFCISFVFQELGFCFDFLIPSNLFNFRGMVIELVCSSIMSLGNFFCLDSSAPKRHPENSVPLLKKFLDEVRKTYVKKKNKK